MPSILKQYNDSSEDDCIRIPDGNEDGFLIYKEETDAFALENEENEFSEPSMEQTFTDGATEEVAFIGEKAGQKNIYTQPLTKEEIATYYSAELEEIYLDSQQKGYAEGLSRKRGELNECIKRVDEQLASLAKMQDHYMRRYGEELKYLAIEIAEKMILQKIEQDDWILEKLVMKNMRDVKKAPWIDVEVSERLIHLVESIKIELDKPEYHGRASVVPTAAPLDTCRVTTEEGTVVATITEQAKNLREAYMAEERKNALK